MEKQPVSLARISAVMRAFGVCGLIQMKTTWSDANNEAEHFRWRLLSTSKKAGNKVKLMANARVKKASEIQDAIRQILFRYWDPIGVNSSENLMDEYDSYIGGVYRILTESRSEDALIDYLTRTETKAMGLKEAPQDRLRSIAQMLLALDVRL